MTASLGKIWSHGLDPEHNDNAVSWTSCIVGIVFRGNTKQSYYINPMAKLAWSNWLSLGQERQTTCSQYRTILTTTLTCFTLLLFTGRQAQLIGELEIQRLISLASAALYRCVLWCQPTCQQEESFASVWQVDRPVETEKIQKDAQVLFLSWW